MNITQHIYAVEIPFKAPIGADKVGVRTVHGFLYDNPRGIKRRIK